MVSCTLDLRINYIKSAQTSLERKLMRSAIWTVNRIIGKGSEYDDHCKADIEKE